MSTRGMTGTVLAVCLAGAFGRIQAQPAITIGEDRALSVAGLDAPVVEPHLSIHPKDPNSFLAGAMVARAGGGYGVIGLASRDGGRTWTMRDFGDGADVWTAFLPQGTAVLSLLSGPGALLQVFRSSDGGYTWNDRPATVARGQDHPTLLVDGKGGLYTISAGSGRGASGAARDAVVVARSADGGATFDAPVLAMASNLSYEAQNPAILGDGTLLIPFGDHHRRGSRRRLQSPRDWLLVSRDRGKTFSEPLLISESCDGRGGWSSLAAFRDVVYHVCTGRELDGIQFRRSGDGGESWSEPVRVDRPGDTTPQTRTPALAVNAEGVVAVAWYDARNDRSAIKGNFRCQEVYFAASVDGGLTFLPEVKVSSKASCPATPGNVETALRFPAGGEYMGLAAAADGSFHLLWADNRDGIYRLHMANVRVR